MSKGVRPKPKQVTKKSTFQVLRSQSPNSFSRNWVVPLPTTKPKNENDLVGKKSLLDAWVFSSLLSAQRCRSLTRSSPQRVCCCWMAQCPPCQGRARWSICLGRRASVSPEHGCPIMSFSPLQTRGNSPPTLIHAKAKAADLVR